MRSRILSLWLPNLATDRLLRRARRGADRTEPPDPHWIRSAARDLRWPERARCGSRRYARALRAGTAPGMMLADARAMVPALQVHPAAPAADARLLERPRRAGANATRPTSRIDRSHPGAAAAGALWLRHHRLRPSVRRRGGAARRPARPAAPPGPGCAPPAIADAPGAAWALARFGADAMQIVPPGGARAALAPCRSRRCGWIPSCQMLERLGLARIERLYPLPRRALVARFGDGVDHAARSGARPGRRADLAAPAAPAHRAQLALRRADRACRGARRR